jgi:RNA polymerase sigma-B factor
MPLARRLAWRYRDSDDIEDLEQIAAIGLLKAIERFDPTRGLAFSTLAFPTILGELRRHLRDRGWSVRPPRDLQTLATRVDRDTSALRAELGRSPTLPEIAARVETSAERITEVLQAATARRALSLDQPTNHDDTRARGLGIAIDETGFLAAENAMLIESLMRHLPRRERRVLNLRFREDLTQAQIGEIVGITQMQVSRTLRAALERLQSIAGNRQAAVSELAGPTPASSPKTIVVVDDERSIRTLVRFLLEDAGHQVVEAANGQAGLAAVANCNAVLIVTDMMMPVMNGREMIARLRADASTAAIPIVVLSAEANLAALRADAAIAKPFRNGDLTETVNTLLMRAG